jgi:hypothetical protein
VRSNHKGPAKAIAAIDETAWTAIADTPDGEGAGAETTYADSTTSSATVTTPSTPDTECPALQTSRQRRGPAPPLPYSSRLGAMLSSVAMNGVPM